MLGKQYLIAIIISKHKKQRKSDSSQKSAEKGYQVPCFENAASRAQRLYHN